MRSHRESGGRRDEKGRERNEGDGKGRKLRTKLEAF